jgi:hypothetical protein
MRFSRFSCLAVVSFFSVLLPTSLAGAQLSGAQLSPPTSENAAILGQQVGKRVVLLASPYDANHAVTSVRFLLDGRTLAEVGGTGRYEWSTTSLRPGRHVIQAQAFSGEEFIGLSEPFAVYVTASPAASVLEVPFFTYELGVRRASDIKAPKLASGTSRPGDQGVGAALPSERVGVAVIEVYLNGVKQEFAPAARLASAEEMSPPKPQPPVRRRSRRKVQTIAKPVTSSKAGIQTVWLPARPLLEKLGARLQWQASQRTLVADIQVSGGNRRILLRAGQPEGQAQAHIAGRRLQLQAPVRQTDNALMVPLSFCMEALDLRVSWQPENRRVEMYTPISPA